MTLLRTLKGYIRASIQRAFVVDYRHLRRWYWEYRTPGLDRTAVTSASEATLIGDLVGRYSITSVLDVGCGSGRLFSVLRDAGVNQILGIDIAQRALAIARRRYPDVLTQRCRAEDLDPRERFDAVIVNRVLQHIHPRDLPTALDCIASAARRVIYLNEITASEGADLRGARYMFQHDFVSDLRDRGWLLAESQLVPETNQTYFVFRPTLALAVAFKPERTSSAQPRVATPGLSVHRPGAAGRSFRLPGPAPGRILLGASLFLTAGVVPLVFSTAVYDNFTLIKQASLLVASALALTGMAIEGNFLPRSTPLRVAVCAWCLVLAASFVFSIDNRESVLGTYQYRQGFVTQVAYLLLFLGALQAARWLPLRAVLGAGAMALLGVALYAGIQKTGHDPLTWWVDTADRAISTIGNANELAAFAVLALAFCGLVPSQRRLRLLAVAAVACLSGFTVLESESRSGLLALGVVAATFPAAAGFARLRRHVILAESSALFAGLALGFVLAVSAGGFLGTVHRVDTGVAQSSVGNSTRVQLWRGAISTIVARPLLGSGPDGLAIAFPLHRPAHLGGAFSEGDVVAQSSHNAVLDVAANYGLAGLGALGAIVALAGASAFRVQRAQQPHDAVPFIWAAAAGYAAMTMVNPLSLAPQAIFFVLLGSLAGQAEPAAGKLAWRPPALARAISVAPIALVMTALALLLPLADMHMSRSWNAYASGNFARGATEAHRAGEINGLEVFYPRREAASWLAGGVDGDQGALASAERTFQQLDERFAFTDSDALFLAMAQVGRREAPDAVELTVRRAYRLAPHGFAVNSQCPTLLTASHFGGRLHFNWDDHIVYVTTER